MRRGFHQLFSGVGVSPTEVWWTLERSLEMIEQAGPRRVLCLHLTWDRDEWFQLFWSQHWFFLGWTFRDVFRFDGEMTSLCVFCSTLTNALSGWYGDYEPNLHPSHENGERGNLLQHPWRWILSRVSCRSPWTTSWCPAPWPSQRGSSPAQPAAQHPCTDTDRQRVAAASQESGWVFPSWRSSITLLSKTNRCKELDVSEQRVGRFAASHDRTGRSHRNYSPVKKKKLVLVGPSILTENDLRQEGAWEIGSIPWIPW